jgi:hypothetical protein
MAYTMWNPRSSDTARTGTTCTWSQNYRRQQSLRRGHTALLRTESSHREHPPASMCLLRKAHTASMHCCRHRSSPQHTVYTMWLPQPSSAPQRTMCTAWPGWSPRPLALPHTSRMPERLPHHTAPLRMPCKASMVTRQHPTYPRRSPRMPWPHHYCTGPQHSPHKVWMRWSLCPPSLVHTLSMTSPKHPSMCPVHTHRTLSPGSSRDRIDQPHKPCTHPTQLPSTCLPCISPHHRHMVSTDPDRCRGILVGSACTQRHPVVHSTPHCTTHTVYSRTATLTPHHGHVDPLHTVCTMSPPRLSTCQVHTLCTACLHHPDRRTQPSS